MQNNVFSGNSFHAFFQPVVFDDLPENGAILSSDYPAKSQNQTKNGNDEQSNKYINFIHKKNPKNDC